jgi:oligoendopeptidase F
VNDDDARIRARVLHIICDGSPNRLEYRVYDALEQFNRDPDPEIRRTAHKVLAKAAKGSWNIL